MILGSVLLLLPAVLCMESGRYLTKANISGVVDEAMMLHVHLKEGASSVDPATNPLESLAAENEAVRQATETLRNHPDGIITKSELKNYIADDSPLALNVEDDDEVVMIPMNLVNPDDFRERPVDIFLRPLLLDPEEYWDYWNSITEKAYLSYTVALVNIMLEHSMFTELVIKNHSLFYCVGFFNTCSRPAVDKILLQLFGTFKTIEAGYYHVLRANPAALGLLLHYGIQTLKVALFCFDDVQSMVDFNKALTQAHQAPTLENINAIIGMVDEYIRMKVRDPRGIISRGTQFTVLMEESFKLGTAFILLVRHQIQSGMPVRMQPRDNHGHYLLYIAYLRENVKPALSLQETVRIVNRTSHNDVNGSLRGQLPNCSHFRNYMIMLSRKLSIEDQNALKKALDEEEKKRARVLEELIEEEVERTLRDAAERAKKQEMTKRRLAAKGKQKAKKKAVTPKPQPYSTSATTTATLPMTSPADPREVEYATFMVGEYLRTRVLDRVLLELGIDASEMSWKEAQNRLETQLQGNLASRKAFIGKCIEWARKRAEIAHPIVKWDKNASALWHDLESVKTIVGPQITSSLTKFLTKLSIDKPSDSIHVLSAFGRPDLGITSERITQTLAILRLTQFILDSTVRRACDEHNIEPTLPRLRNWRTNLSFLSVLPGLDDTLMEALAGLVEKRNEMAHPMVTPQIVKVLVEGSLQDSPDYALFLSKLAPKSYK